MKNIPTPVLWFCCMVLAMWALAGVYTLASPVVTFNDSASMIEPKIVKKGGIVRVYREFEAMIPTQVDISRSLQIGNCKKVCEVIDLPATHRRVELGKHMQWREIQLPDSPVTGHARLAITVRWKTMFGTREFTYRPLEFEIVP